MSERVTVKHIAEKAGVSITTVNKALNNKDRISEAMREKILEIARQLNYTPNNSAKALARNDIKIGIVYPEEPIEFYTYVRNGLNAGLNSLIDQRVKGIFKPAKTLDAVAQFQEALKQLSDIKVDGIILSPGFNLKEYECIVRQISDSGIPILYLVNGLFHKDEKPCVRTNHFVAGKMAAQMVAMGVRGGRNVALMTCNKEIVAHRITIEGFIQEAKKYNLNIKGIFETQDDKEIAYYLTEKVIKMYGDLDAIYITSYNSVAVCNKLEEMGINKKIFVIGHDLYPELVENLKAGTLNATLFQNPFKQGEQAVKAMFEYINNPINGLKSILISPQIVLESNLECFEGMY
jgi:LacI family transcriptional regulator